MNDADYLILELYRFDDDGRRRLKFYENKVEMLDGSTWNVIYRASTFVGVDRFIEEQEERFSNARVIIYPINTEENLEDSSFARAHSELCKNLIESCENFFECIHCGDVISEDETHFIEIDEENKKHCVGLVHKKCLNSLDRVLGIIHSDLFRTHKLLKNFDYSVWFKAILAGQGLFAAISQYKNNVISIVWNPDYNQISKGNWCVRINLEDGSALYVHERGRVVRCSEVEAIKKVQKFNKSFEEAWANEDPWCYTSESGVFIIYSGALELLDNNERCLLCVDAQAVKYTQSIGNTYSKSNNYYAPLAFLIDESTGDPIIINNTIFLISNPLSLEKYIENWSRAGIKLPEFVISIIDSDDRFDIFVRQAKDNNIEIIVNPMLLISGELSGGFVIENMKVIVDKKS